MLGFTSLFIELQGLRGGGQSSGRREGETERDNLAAACCAEGDGGVESGGAHRKVATAVEWSGGNDGEGREREDFAGSRLGHCFGFGV